MSPLKRLEKYFSAFFKLGRIARQSKQASIAVGVLEPRLDAVQGELDGLRRLAWGDDRASAEIAALGARLESVERALFGAEGGRAAAAGLGAPGDTGLTGNIAALSEGLSAAVDRLAEQLEALAEQGSETAGRVGSVETRLQGAEARARALTGEQRLAGRAQADLSRRLDLIRFERGAAPAGAPPGPAPERREGLDALIDAFYNRLEDRFRGGREEIKGRLAVYLPEIRAAVARSARPVLDLGCGRGEWLELLAEAGIAAEGVDTNPMQIAEAGPGLAIREGDALAALAEAPDGAYAAVTAHHLVEHLPFDRVVWMTREALRCLAPGGVLIYETPNPRNLIVGATTFHIDPTHRRPLPAEVLTTLMDTAGFHPVEARPLHPSETREAVVAEGRLDPDIADLLFGPQDLAVIGTRPATGG